MPKTKLTNDEKAFLKRYSELAIDEEEVADAARHVPGPLGDAAMMLILARSMFERELERIGYEHG